MKMPAFISEKSISLWEKIRLWDSSHRSSRAGVSSNRGDNVKEIFFEDFHEIFGYDNSEDVRETERLENEFKENRHSKNNPNLPTTNETDSENESDCVTEKKDERAHIYIPERAYIKHITEKAHKYKVKDCISIEEMPEEMPVIIGESKSRYRVKYKITIENLKIKVGTSNHLLLLDFDEPEELYIEKDERKVSNLDFTNKGGICFFFENNSFVLSSPNAINDSLLWSLGKNRHLIFKQNEFKSIDMEMTIKGESELYLMDNYFDGNPPNPYRGISIHGESIKVTLEGNYFDNLPLRIRGISDGKSCSYPIDDFWSFFPDKKELARRMEKRVNGEHSINPNKNIKDIEDKVKEEGIKTNIKDILKMLLYMDKKITVDPNDLEHGGESIVQLKDNCFFRLAIASHKCYFSGENIINKLEINKDIRYLYWEPRQDINHQGKQAHDHKQMFIELIERAVQNNDKILEAKLRRELLKCEKALVHEEKTLRSMQDIIILGWGSLVSDYGISWIRPMLGLFIINALLATVVCFSPSQNPSWWFLFFDFLSPLSNLSDSDGIKNNTWIAFINIVQKIFLALFLYEIIKIFRRFSK